MPTTRPALAGESTGRAPRTRKTKRVDPEHAALITIVETVLAEWTGPGPIRPHGVAHHDPGTGLLTWHLRGLPAQLDHIHTALRAVEPAEVRLAHTLTAIAALDPSRHGHTGPDTPEITAAYVRRNALIWTALALAHEAGVPAGVGHDPSDPHPVVVYIELPTGQAAWHLPAHPTGWDGHSTAAKYARVAAFAATID
ncbi:hypothetical protein JNW91_15820 [Micromonospora sp. STR1_7]|uniref:Uncharacterized protein n=1 Tax=Micromonospora parastrephiae TaxID=2806101 RepID=A0ABS1XVD0_9ACTN|nr:hypothetical protein [Micromonospora parastrephiae]MBM0233203.1 hypothetical protein [Micromonospora parastrephiae]